MSTTEKGRRYEQAAADRMTSEGYWIIQRNYYSRYGEIDIIASDGKYLVFAEVRARKTGAPVGAVHSITKSKIHKICKTAMMYLSENKTDLQPRFDVIAITISPAGDILEYNHIKNAFDYEVSYDEYENF